MRRLRLTRGQKIAGNLALCALLGLALYAMAGFPPYTVRGMLRQTERQYLLAEGQPVYVLKEPWGTESVFKRHYTFIIARAGEEYVAFQYDRHLLRNDRDVFQDVTTGSGALAVARRGVIYAAAPTDAPSAAAVVTVDGEPFPLAGQRLNGEVFAFPYREENAITSELEEAAERTYRQAMPGSDPEHPGYSMDNVPLPCVVTFYGDDGAALSTLELEVMTYHLWRW